MINNKSTVDELNPFGTSTGASVRYITKRVSLNQNRYPNRMRVFVDSIKSVGTDIEVYIKYKKFGDTRDFDDIEYVKLQRQGSERFSTDPNDVITEEFRLTSFEEMDTFAIKVCLFSDDTSNVPRVKSMRAVALKS